MITDPLKYQIPFLKRIGSEPKDLPKFCFAINLAHHNIKVSENRHMIYMVERYIARREAKAKEAT